MSWVMDYSLNDFTHSRGKVYLSVIMGLIMVLVEWILMIPVHHNIPFFWLTLLLFLGSILFFIYLYRSQVLIGDKEFLNDMIEHHSMAILTSEEILKKTKNPEVEKLAKGIIQTQTKEIDEMKGIVESI